MRKFFVLLVIAMFSVGAIACEQPQEDAAGTEEVEPAGETEEAGEEVEAETEEAAEETEGAAEEAGTETDEAAEETGEEVEQETEEETGDEAE